MPDTLSVYLRGVQVAASGVTSLDEVAGSFTLTPAPSGSLQASFYYQWFTDDELVTFLTEASNMLMFESPSGDIAIGLRPTLLQFACYNAYMRKAAEFAETVESSAAGYTFKRDQATPNWTKLAEIALKVGQEKLKLYVDNPLNTSNPALSFITFRMRGYQPP